jgi:hypothetical protein
MLVPLDHRLPDAVLESVKHPQRHIDLGIRDLRDELLVLMKQNRFLCHFIATGGDNGVEGSHKATFEKYAGLGETDIRAILAVLTNDGTEDLEYWTASDPLHLLKNARSREALGTLAFNGETDDFVAADTLTRNMPKGEKHVFTTREPLDLLRDGLAIQAFTLKHLLHVWYGGQLNDGPDPGGGENPSSKLDSDPDEGPNPGFEPDRATDECLNPHPESDGDPGFEFAPDSGARTEPDPTGGYFLLPLVVMSLAVRNPGLDMASRFEMIQLAFSVFFEYMQKYPKCLWRSNVSQGTIDAFKRKTLWTPSMCCRACNTCICVYWAITKYGGQPHFELALNRIGSHSVECHFGMTRSTLKGDARWE